MFHSQIGTRKNTVLDHQFGNNMFHSQMGIRNETLLNVQFWNKLFHLQTGTRNKTVLIFFRNDLAPVVQRPHSAIHRINHYPADSAVCFVNTYPLDRDLSGG